MYSHWHIKVVPSDIILKSERPHDTPSILQKKDAKNWRKKEKKTIQVLVERMNVPHIAEQMKNLEAYNQEIAKRCPWVPFAQ